MTLTADETTVLRAIEAAGGALTLAGIVDALDPGTMTAASRDFARRSLRPIKAVACLAGRGLLERPPFTNERALTPAGRDALARIGALHP